MSERRTMYAVHLLTLLLVAQLPRCAAELKCPELAYIGYEANLTCIGANTLHAYSKPRGSTATTCSVTSQHCINTGDDTGAVINATNTVLTIISVKQSDAGEWGCTLGSESTPSKCCMTVANVPRCNISSDKNTDTLALHEDLALTVDIQEYYCSAQYSFTLLVGEVIVQLPVSETVNKSTDKTATTIVNVTDISLGVVQLVFRCHNVEQNLSCDGVKFINDINVPTTFPTRSTASSSTPSMSTMSNTRIVAAVVSFIVIVVVSLKTRWLLLPPRSETVALHPYI